MNRYQKNSLSFLAFLMCSVFLLQSCQQEKTESKLVGYIEADYRFVSSLQSGLITKQFVKAGDEIKKGDFVFELDNDLITLQIKEVQARVDQAKAMVDDSLKGLRKDEIDSLEAQLEEAITAVNFKKKELERIENLLNKGLVAKSIGDAASADFEVAQAQVHTIQAKIRVAKLPARDGVINNAKANLLAVEQQLAQLNWQLSQRTVVSNFSGKIFDVYFEQGENIASGQPLLAIIPNNELTVKFFVEQTMLSKMQLGQTVYVFADGIDAPFEASVSYIATSAQFTPPVIYSKESREKMVFKLEAKILNPNNDYSLPLGLPVDISLNK